MAPCRDFRRASFASNITAVVGEHLRIVAQSEFNETPTPWKTELDYGFAEWKFSDALQLRAGKARLPFGISQILS